MIGQGSLAVFIAGLSLWLLPGVPSGWVFVAVGLVVLLLGLSPLPLVIKRFLLLLLILTAWDWVYTRIQLNAIYQDVPRRVPVCGWIDSIPKPQTDVTSFEFLVATPWVDKRLKLSWYYAKQSVTLGEYWCFQARLKPPRGLANPGGFDYELWSLLHRFSAQGYVVSGEHYAARDKRWSLALFRAYLFKHLPTESAHTTHLIAALSLGIRHLEPQTRLLYQQVGISHLIAISGLHIGLFAGLVVVLLERLIRMAPAFSQWLVPWMIIRVFATFIAACYALLAGFSLPTQRAVMMLMLARFTRGLKLNVAPLTCLWWVFFVSLIINPWCILDASFLLSFNAVVVILLALHGQHAPPQGLKIQWVVSVGLLPLTAWLFHSVSLIGVIVNIIAIPWFSFVILPLSLLTTLSVGFPGLQLVFYNLVRLNITVFDALCHQAIRLPYATQPFPCASPAQCLAMILAGLLLITPKGWPGKRLAGLLVVIALYPMVNPPLTTQLTVLDVGQGLSIVFQHQKRVLVFDTGPRFGRSDAAERVIIPYLQSIGVRHLDTVVVSHGDLDHRGGFQSLIKRFPAKNIFSGEPRRLAHPGVVACRAGQRWDWGDVTLEVLSPQQPNKGNNSSCVLLITAFGRRILLPGDIETTVEQELARQWDEDKPIDILVAAHHGSKTSSTPDLINKLRPHYVVFSTGYQNRFHFPHALVVERLCHQAQCFNTTTDGAITFQIDQQIMVRRTRWQHQHFWHRVFST